MSETLKRIISGLIIGSLVIFVIFYQGFYSILALFLVFCLCFLALGEFYRLADRSSLGIGAPFYKVGYFFSAGIILSSYASFLKTKEQGGYELSASYADFVAIFAPDFSLVSLFLLFLLFSSAALQLLYRPLQGALYSLSVTLLGPVYTVLTMCCAFYLLALPGGQFYVFLFLLLPIASDTGAYFSGLYFGRHRVGFRLSPKKTYEGYIGAFLLTVLTGPALLWLWKADILPVFFLSEPIALGYGEIFFLSMGICFAAILGDLLESALKRDIEKKDSGSLIPGHGGMLDLLDAIYWSFPLGYFYLSLRQLLGYSLS